MRVGEIRSENAPPVDRCDDTGETTLAASPSRALIPLTPAPVAHEPPRHFRQAPFLAQLIATREQLQQTRARRRAEPAEALAAYRTMADLKG